MRSTKKYSKRKQYGRTKKNRRVRRYRGGSSEEIKTLEDRIQLLNETEPPTPAEIDEKNTQLKKLRDELDEMKARIPVAGEQDKSDLAGEQDKSDIAIVDINGKYAGKYEVKKLPVGGRRRKSAHRRRTRRRKH
jgi:predicted  nucleic acid-binding Zn-ribbon protein